MARRLRITVKDWRNILIFLLLIGKACYCCCFDKFLKNGNLLVKKVYFILNYEFMHKKIFNKDNDKIIGKSIDIQVVEKTKIAKKINYLILS